QRLAEALEILDSHFRGNDGMQVRGNDVVQVRRNDVVQVSVRMDSSFPRRRESRHSMLRQFIGND
ncbi:hypothetical protein, partial [Neisseria meningitidis]|uniref:hypothetical protein n=1 Tax=Neisseria meningitidis TaxID=487 RepID=UPI001E583411